MLQSEFIERTGLQVTAECYHEFIEPEYDGSTLNKDEWCKQWKRNGGISRAYTWQCRHYEDRIKEANRISIENEDVQKQVSELKKELAHVKELSGKRQDNLTYIRETLDKLYSYKVFKVED